MAKNCTSERVSNMVQGEKGKFKDLFTFASLLTVGLLANCTSVALRIVFSSKMVA
jgi:predicted metal-binding protein